MQRNSEVKASVAIIGIGSPHGDDRWGWVMAERLAHSPALQSTPHCVVEVLRCDSPISQLYSMMCGRDAVILLDAVISDTAPVGEIMRLDEWQLPQCRELLSSHGWGVPQALALGRALGGLPEHIVLYGLNVAVDVPPRARKEWFSEARYRQLETAVVAEVAATVRRWKNPVA
ncbi:MAG: hydrogenase maturation protease [Halothiobacillaceae bacterium]|nr:MAG: hydrogenase maturation protease [Halothiobacillaceae bacterium]